MRYRSKIFQLRNELDETRRQMLDNDSLSHILSYVGASEHICEVHDKNSKELHGKLARAEEEFAQIQDEYNNELVPCAPGVFVKINEAYLELMDSGTLSWVYPAKLDHSSQLEGCTLREAKKFLAKYNMSYVFADEAPRTIVEDRGQRLLGKLVGEFVTVTLINVELEVCGRVYGKLTSTDIDPDGFSEYDCKVKSKDEMSVLAFDFEQVRVVNDYGFSLLV